MLSIQEQTVRVVAARNFFNTGALRQDCVMLRGPNTASGSVEVWFAKVLTFIRIEDVPLPYSETFMTIEREVAFIQYFEVIPLSSTLDRTLGCVKLQWARNGVNSTDHDRNVLPGSWYGITPASSVLGLVHIVPAAEHIATGHENGPPWYEHMFYVNKFMRFT